MKAHELSRLLAPLFLSKVEAFHGDKNLQSFVSDALRRYRITSFAETGTFRGDTLLWLAAKHPEIECLSSEIQHAYFVCAKLRTLFRPNVSVFRKDSRSFIREIRRIVHDPVLFWLDAHWGNDWPLLDELGTVQELYRSCLVLIDDFQIPDRPGFGFDTYEREPLNLEYISAHLRRECEVWLADYEPETASRGVCAIYIGLKGVWSNTFKRVSIRPNL